LLIPLLAPLALILAALAAFAGPSFRPRRSLRIVEGAALIAVAVAVVSALLLVRCTA
jgi:NAD(P)H-quinone oxidoreductase subunit 5